MWFLERFIPKLDGAILKQNMGCGPAPSSAQEAEFLLGLCRVLYPHTAPDRAALLGWDGAFCSAVMGHGAIAQPVSMWVPSQNSAETPELSAVRSVKCVQGLSF